MTTLKNTLGFLLFLILLVTALSVASNVRDPEPPPLQQHHLSALILESRQTPEVVEGSSSGSGWLVAGVTLVVLLFAGFVGLAYFGADLLKQWRLTSRTRRKKKSPAPRPQPQAGPAPEIRTVPVLREVKRG